MKKVIKVSLVLLTALAVILTSLSMAGVLKRKVEFNRKPIMKVKADFTKEYYKQYFIVGGLYQWNASALLSNARQFVNDRREEFIQEIVTALGFQPVLVAHNDNEISQYPGRQTGIYGIKWGWEKYHASGYIAPDIQLDLNATMSYRVEVKVKASPIVLDLDGNGRIDSYKGHYLPLRDLRGVKASDLKLVRFDIDGTNYKVLVEWIGPNDGYLVKPVDPERTLETGVITAEEMFGTAGGYENGFDKLSLLDRNGDRILRGEELEGLYVFQDKNVNGKVEKGELIPLKDLGITELGLNHKDYKSYFIMNGERRVMWDFWPITLNGRTLAK